jgi:RNA polymerase sigma factor (sigma-70 family)
MMAIPIESPQRPAARRTREAAAEPEPAAPPPFEAAFESHGAEIYRFLRRFAADTGEAADLHQETFLRAFRAYGRLSAGANVRAWLYRIAGNLAVDAHRRRGRSIEADREPVEWAATAGDPEAAVRSQEVRSAVRSALLELSPSQRLGVAARVLDGAEYDEVAELLGCSQESARQHVSQGLRRLRAALSEWR